MCKRGYCRSGTRLGPSVQDIAGMMMQESRGAAGIGNIGGAPGRSTKIGPNAEDQALKCPRCDSPNTKFCYYNNYNLTQPRHFCKTCRRYWTKGGALRNVPVGGGCRKNKRPKQRSRDPTPLPIALDHRHRHPNPNPQHRGDEESPSPAAVALLQNLWGTSSNSNFPDLGPAVPARLQNRPNLLGPASAIQHGHMAYENPAAILSNLGFALPEPNLVCGADDILQWRIQQQQQSRLAAALQQQNLNNPNTDNHPSHSHVNPNDNNNTNVDLMPISPTDHHHLLLQQQQKGKSIVSGDLQAEWPAMTDYLFEPQAVESTSGYWCNDGFAELTGLQCVAGIDGGHLQRNRCTL